MNAHDRDEVLNLTRCRRWLWHNGQFRHELPIEERARRVAEYARQVATHGEIVAYLPPAQPRNPAYRSRFANGDVLRPQTRN